MKKKHPCKSPSWLSVVASGAGWRGCDCASAKPAVLENDFAT